MTMLTETKRNGDADSVTRFTDASVARIERRVAELEARGEERICAMRDAAGEFIHDELTPRDEKIVSLEQRVADLEQRLEQQAAIDQRVNEISARLEERQARLDRGKNEATHADSLQTMGMMIAQERQSAREEFKAANEEMRRAFEAKLAAVEERLKTVPGQLPVVKIFRSESVTYEAEVVSYDGSLYQARKDTAQAPGGSDWVCVARRPCGPRWKNAECLRRIQRA